ncbi:hypothetical protein lerEdw1_017918 [Lerista edwardsae]|nr:hypothetical protein lerEdw1_017918 [Lerista edwardsae]
MPSEVCLSIQDMLTGQRLCQSSSHNDSVLAALNQQRSDGTLCDITLVAEEQKFHAHKAVLAACSDYFRVVMSLAQIIGGDGFEDVQEENVAEILTQFVMKLTNEEFDAIVKAGREDIGGGDYDVDEDKEGTLKIVLLSIAKLEKWASLFNEASKGIQDPDP